MTFIYRRAVADNLIEPAVKLLWRDLQYRGVTAEQWREWSQHAFPHLAWEAPFRAIVERLRWVFELGEPCWQPQIIFALPTDYQGELLPHVDEPPHGMTYTRILAVALTEWTDHNGSIHVWHDPMTHHAVYMQPGDVLDLPVHMLHSPGVNYSDAVRIGMYVRWAVPATVAVEL